MKNDKEIEPVEIFTGKLWQAQSVKNLLENSGIEAFLLDEIVGSLNFPWASAGGIGLVKVIVSTADFENAKLIVYTHENNTDKQM